MNNYLKAAELKNMKDQIQIWIDEIDNENITNKGHKAMKAMQELIIALEKRI
jgi:hypothetical protein